MSIVVDVNRFPNVISKDPNLNGSSSTSTHGENNNEKLKKVAQDGDVERLYELIAEDPNILGHFDKVPFCATPLHIAAEKGKTHFAMELMTLKPSLASKLNVAGYSPMHLALQNNHSLMVRGFVAIDSSLVSIKGRGSERPVPSPTSPGNMKNNNIPGPGTITTPTLLLRFLVRTCGREGRLPWYTRHPVPLDVVHTPCSVLRPLPAKTRRDSILPAPLFLLAVFERYGRRVSHTPHQSLGDSKVAVSVPDLALGSLDERKGVFDLRSTSPKTRKNRDLRFYLNALNAGGYTPQNREAGGLAPAIGDLGCADGGRRRRFLGVLVAAAALVSRRASLGGFTPRTYTAQADQPSPFLLHPYEVACPGTPGIRFPWMYKVAVSVPDLALGSLDERKGVFDLRSTSPKTRKNRDLRFYLNALNAGGYTPQNREAGGLAPAIGDLGCADGGRRRRFLGVLVAAAALVSRRASLGRVTPLHHVAQIGDAELLSEFLFACPSSIEDLTVKCETAVHVAVKNGNFMAFKVLLGWLKRVKKEEILDWKDEDGNTVFHIAAMMNHTEVMKLLRKTVKVEAKNLDGKTAMDILQPGQFRYGSTTTLAGYLSNNLSFMERRNNLLGLSNLGLTGKTSPNASERRDALLVVAILIATATYQAGLSPPGGFWQENSLNPNDGNGHKAGQMTMVYKNALVFIVLNGLAFLSSLLVIIILIMELPMWKLLYGSVAALSVAMSASYITIFPNPNGELEKLLRVLFIMAFPLAMGTMLYYTFIAFTSDKESRHKVDFQASYFSSYHTASRDNYLLFMTYS
ncbi:hypothetical protein IGI04_031541 [Brassica rapa subsp. trilocularis]|uniref:PGG domain-containing protein n=1 Tax=Brassica rapa subsp. trilocularis TaxID=1813537 RepID=A0ABQ7LTX0_BRACM|nr:hypothetical protein IGI04_031541 [Brassica rapa subsp. trilocularis]